VCPLRGGVARWDDAPLYVEWGVFPRAACLLCLDCPHHHPGYTLLGFRVPTELGQHSLTPDIKLKLLVVLSGSCGSGLEQTIGVRAVARLIGSSPSAG
jgi:hypothetical protein